MTDPEIKYGIEAEVKGDVSVERLAASPRGLGETLDGDLKKQAHAAADGFIR